ncbi:hypothetical protein ACOXXX_00080 [Thalassococcus sp. BH17M4-6]|uniref:hypothetical protein n=1 Tax=Thalassococcus sp. BH17M4-6 TaxID=3413148 RepID=UPI003BDDDBDC
MGDFSKLFPLICLVPLGACSDMMNQAQPQPAAAAPPPAEEAAAAPVISRTPPPAARTVEDFDTTTAEERAAAAAPAEPAGERSLGTTVASLGDPARPGFWLETTLVDAPTSGRVLLPGTGKSAQVDLIPIADGGSRISLAAMRLIGASLTDLPTIEVFAGG